MQRPDGAAALVEDIGPLARALGIERLPGMDLALARRDAVEAGLDEVARLEALVGHAQEGGAGRQSVGRSCHVVFPLVLGSGHDGRAEPGKVGP